MSKCSPEPAEFQFSIHFQNELLDSRLHSSGAKWALTVQLAACSHDQKLLRKTARAIVATKNAAVYASALQVGSYLLSVLLITPFQSDFSLHYNGAFRKYLWAEIAKMSTFEKTALFSTNSTSILPASRILLHSVKTIDELQQVSIVISCYHHCYHFPSDPWSSHQLGTPSNTSFRVPREVSPLDFQRLSRRSSSVFRR